MKKNDKIVVEDEDFFCTYLKGGAVTNGGESNSCLNALLAGLPLATGQSSLKHDCGVIETLLI